MKARVLLAAFLLVALQFFAQDSEEAMRGPDRGTEYTVNGISVLPLPGKPFSGRSTTEWIRTLEDGTVVTTHLFAAVARDSQGRIFRERRSFVPMNSSEQSKLTEIRIFDPTTHTRTYCQIATHRCQVTGYYAPVKFVPMPVGSFDSGKRFLAREVLGNEAIDGIDVLRTRETVTIEPGVLGNSQSLVITREFWYSPELEVNLAIIRKDPREGTQNIRVGELSRTEPDPALFKIPSGFVVEGTAPAKTGN